MPLRIVVLSLLIAGLTGCQREVASPADGSVSEASQDATPAPSVKLTAFVAASLNQVMEQLSTASVSAAGPALTINAAGTQALVAQLQAGVTADLFCSASRRYGDEMATAGLTGPAQTLALNELVLAATPLNQKVSQFDDLTGDGIKIVRCDSSVPAGDYTDRALDALRAAGSGATADAIGERVASLEGSVSGVVAKLTTGAADAGFCYRTDMVAAGLREVPLPVEMRLTTEYTVAVVSNSPHPTEAEAFVAWLASPGAAEVLTNAGFTLPQPATAP